MHGRDLRMVLILVVLCGVFGVVLPQFSPYLFVCNYHGGLDQGDLDQGEIALSVAIEGNPAYYVPGHMYQVSIATSSDFNGLLITGLYSSTSFDSQLNPAMSFLFGGSQPGVPSHTGLGSNHMCSIVHQHMGLMPKKSSEFYWIAPPEGSGCVSFLATASLQQHVLFKDALALQLCEAGMPTQAPFRPQLAMVHSEGVILRDDFDSSQDLDYSIWSEAPGGNISDTCGTVLHGNSMVFCQPTGIRELTTVHLNTTTASVLQFALSSGHCRLGHDDYSITVAYAVNNRVDWHIIDKIRVPSDAKTTIHILHLPNEARKEGVCLRFYQDLAMDSQSYQGCWALDNILVGNAAYRPEKLEENFDPIDPGNWLFFPNGAIKSQCQADGNALFFHGHHGGGARYQFASTHELNLLTTAAEQVLFEEHFTGSSLPSNWEFAGATIGNLCGTLHSGESVVFSGGDERLGCTPFLDTKQAGNLRFYFSMGSGSCDPSDSEDVEVSVLAYVAGKNSPVLLEKLSHSSYKTAQMVSIVVPPKVQTASTRFCLVQTNHQGDSRNVWAIDELQLLPWLPQNITHHAQFSLNLNCGSDGNEDSKVDFEFSTNHGRTWSLLTLQCLPGVCEGEPRPENSTYTIQDMQDGWSRITIPLPFASLASQTRFRWRQRNQLSTAQWAIDNVYIGNDCGAAMCSGHGRCSNVGCSCDQGFTGSSCQIPPSPPPTNLTESFQNFDVQEDAKFTTIRGVELGYKCGVLATGKALVFNKEGRRELITRELNTTDARYLQFTIRIGSHSSVGSCSAPTETNEGVLVLYTCNNGIIWNTLKHLEYDQYHKPRMELIHLPTEARQQSCRFRWWQPSHSGANQDAWALDDITIADTLYNTIWVDFTSDKDIKKAMSFHLGEVGDACGATSALVFSGPAHNGSERYAETQSIKVGASYMIQFDLVMGCGEAYGEPQRKDKKVHLEFSKDHGLSWQHVQERCLPGQIGCHSYHAASIFDDTQYEEWNRVTVILPRNLRSPSVRFRWRQSVFAASDTWALDNIYIGEQCPDMCHGHGACVNGICRCNSGYIGKTCIPEFPLSSSIQSDFEESGLLQSDWLAVHGGEIVHNGETACGIITSGASLYFSQAGVRQLVSHDLNTQLANFIQFYIRLGGDESDQTCRNVNEREEGVLLQYSNDGGITWSLLLELYYNDYKQPKFVHQALPDTACTPSTRLRWWQPSHSGANDDQWALDQVYIGSHNSIQTAPGSFQNDNPVGHLWLTVSNGNVGSYCSSGESALIFTGTAGDRFAVTKAMNVRHGDVIQFKIVVGCGSSFTHFSPVHLEFSQDGGMQWEEVVTSCYPSQEGSCQGSHGNYQDGSVYHMGQYAYWKLVVIEMPNRLTRGKVQFRWWQQADKRAPVFALDSVYVGPKCPSNCNGHGVCQDGQCVCDHGYQGEICEARSQTPSGLNDQFEDNNPSALWAATTGGSKGRQCGVIKMANSLYFGSVGPREARTMGLNTTSIKIAQFYIRIGGSTLGSQCLQATNHNEAVLVQFSTENGISWETLRVIDPLSTLQDEPIKVTIKLPPNAKTPDTVFRWWQPLTSQSVPRAQWALDNVLIGANDTHSYGFEDHFESGPSSDSWYMIMGGHAKQFCNSASNTLVFDSEQGMPRYAETWDYHITMSTFLQFNLVVGCGQSFEIPSAHSVYLEYSLDMGKTWKLVSKECIPPDMGCGEYNRESVYGAVIHGNWTRVTVYLPEETVSDSTRFRWSQPDFTPDADIWAIDDVYLGNGCPWMCSGHGSCVQGQCICDSGYSGPFCVPRLPLPKELKDTFNGADFSTFNWISGYGGSLGNMCGILVSGTAALFNQPGLRMLSSLDLDCTMMEYIQFTFQYGCPSNTPGNGLSSSRSNSVLLQYSNNGGISWTLLEEMHYVAVLPPKFFNIKLPMGAKTNATRFRFWQPSQTGTPWALDNILIGGNSMNHGWLYDDFSDSSPSNYKWLFHPGGRVGPFCTTGNQVGGSSATQTRSRVLDHHSALVFPQSAGGRYVTTRDIDVDEYTVVQFEINIGCADHTLSSDPVHLQYSRDQGSSWDLLRPDCFSSNQSTGICTSHLSPSSVYYSGERQEWYRVVIPLAGLHICGSVRFRWCQGFYSHRDNPKSWALDNVYIGSQCPRHCNGHGLCLDGMHCRCDEGYGGNFCYPTSANMNFLKESFEGQHVDSRKFSEWSGAEITDKCGTLITGKSLHFTGTGKRMLLTSNMDLTTASALQFYIRLGCQSQSPSKRNHPILLQFSSDGGITWVTMETMAFSEGSNTPMYVALEVPFKARTNATIVRWWQASHEGSFLDEWAIDQIFIGGHINGQSVLEDDFASSLQRDSNQIFSLHEQNWLLSPGSTMQQVCGSGVNALYFSGNDIMRYTITADVMVTDLTFLQFELAMGCVDSQQCYEVELEYSLDMGKHWQLLYDWCLPSDVDCRSYHGDSRFTADVFYGWNRVMIPLPAYTRSKATRFRWRQPSGFNPSDSWALSYVYIGSECSRMCTGHGRCNGGLCVCDVGWQGSDCSTPSRQLAHQLRATFSETPRIERGQWSQITGAILSAGCGPVASGKYLFFNGACSRLLVTDDLDLSHVDHIQFYFRYGCDSVPTTRDEGVLLEYSTNGGISWNLLMELFHSEYSVSKFLSVHLPSEAKHNGTRIKWWQPKHPGLNQANWAIDNVIIGGSASLPSSLDDNFETGCLGNHWMFTDNTVLSPFCEAAWQTDGTTHGVTNSLSLMGGIDPSENTTVTSTDLRLQQDSVLEFKISIGCNGSWDSPIEPIHLFYSTDYGVTWDYLISQCLQGDPQCNGVVSPASVYFSLTGWRRVVIPLPEKLTSRTVRFRWFQHATNRPDVSQHWAIDDINIGPKCPNMCSGHGSCDYPQCNCDEGFSGVTCETIVSDLPTYMKERIAGGECDSSIWGLIQGGTVTSPLVGCGVVSEGWSLYFSGQGLRVAETVDMDLRDSSFVQYHAVIGGDRNITTCHQATGRDEGVILQYSTDGGITWYTLAELDYQQYQPARHDYLSLPTSARTQATRLKWWQPVITGKNQAQWALDDVYIGGSDINPTMLTDTFDSALDETLWEFHPFGSLELQACGNTYGTLYWPNIRGSQYGNGYITTQPLIVDKDYIVQFKINVGCQDTAERCTTDHAVRLEFNTDPSSDQWIVLLPACMPDDAFNTRCDVNEYHSASVFTANQYSNWQRVTFDLPLEAISSSTRLRWMQDITPGQNAPSWALDEVFIGAKCPDLCNGHGSCTSHGQCNCDQGFIGDRCTPALPLSHQLNDNFEGGISSALWSVIHGGRLGNGCGGLVPHAHGKSLYFSQCGAREGITAEFDTTRASELMFVLQIGSSNVNPSCNVDLTSPNLENKGVLLHYTNDNGIHWHLIQSHDPQDYMRAQRVSYALPKAARGRAVRFRWWQPEHDGANTDQWAIDHIQLIMSRRNNILFPRRTYGNK